jgi:hypothetical protein
MILRVLYQYKFKNMTQQKETFTGLKRGGEGKSPFDGFITKLNVPNLTVQYVQKIRDEEVDRVQSELGNVPFLPNVLNVIFRIADLKIRELDPEYNRQLNDVGDFNDLPMNDKLEDVPRFDGTYANAMQNFKDVLTLSFSKDKRSKTRNMQELMFGESGFIAKFKTLEHSEIYEFTGELKQYLEFLTIEIAKLPNIDLSIISVANRINPHSLGRDLDDAYFLNLANLEVANITENTDENVIGKNTAMLWLILFTSMPLFLKKWESLLPKDVSDRDLDEKFIKINKTLRRFIRTEIHNGEILWEGLGLHLLSFLWAADKVEKAIDRLQSPIL